MTSFLAAIVRLKVCISCIGLVGLLACASLGPREGMVKDSFSEGLVGHWPLNGNANDVSGKGHHGKVIGATPTQGASGGTYHFNGEAAIDLGPLDFSSEQFTVSGWIRTSEPARYECWRVWIDKIDESGGSFELGIGDGRSEPTHAANGPKAEAWKSICGGAFYMLKDDTKLNLRDGRWHMYSLTYQKGSQRLYVDGELFASGTYSDRLPSTPAHVMIGGSHFGPYHHPWIGDVGEVLIYNRTLSDDEVMRVFQIQRSGKTYGQP